MTYPVHAGKFDDQVSALSPALDLTAGEATVE